MQFAQIVLLGVALAAITVNAQDPHGELLLVQMLFRHGSRTPVSTYPGDLYANYTYSEGPGGLTARGKERMFRYGEIAHARYGQYLENIQLKNIQAQSSPVRRCLESSLSVLGGLFPPVRAQVWSTDFGVASTWQPIAVSTVEPARAYLLGTTASCPEIDKLELEIPKLARVQQFVADNQDFLARFAKQSGLADAVKSYLTVANVSDTIHCQQDYFRDAFRNPEWIDKVGVDVWQKLDEFRNFGFTLAADLPQKYLRLRAGPLLKELVHNFQLTASKGTIGEHNKELFIYGTHDHVASYILHALGLFREQPSFGSGLVFELRKEPKTSAPHVHLFYVNGTQNFEFTSLELHQSDIFKAHCLTAACPLANFTAALTAFLPENIEKECGH